MNDFEQMLQRLREGGDIVDYEIGVDDEELERWYGFQKSDGWIVVEFASTEAKMAFGRYQAFLTMLRKIELGEIK